MDHETKQKESTKEILATSFVQIPQQDTLRDLTFRNSYNNDEDIEEIREIFSTLNLDDLPSIDDENDDHPINYTSLQHHGLIKLSMIDFDCYEDVNQAIRQLRQHMETIDLVLGTTDGAFEPIHQYYLALRAPKFFLRIQTEWWMNNSIDNSPSLEMIELFTVEGLKISVPKLILPNLNGHMLKIIIEALYNVPEQVSSLDYSLTWKLLQIAYEFDLDFLLDTCLNYLRQHISTNNCVLLMQVGLKFQHQPLTTFSYRFIQVNLVKILQSTTNYSLMHLTLNQLKTLIQDDRLNISNEIYIWYLIHQWIMFDCKKRLEHFWMLFSLIRFNMLDENFIKNRLINDFVQLNYHHNNYLIDSYRLKNPKINLMFFNPRIPYQIVFMYGGYEDGFPSNIIHTFDVRACKWFRFRVNQNYIRVHHKLVNCGRKIYIIGGSDGVHCLNTMICWDLNNGQFNVVKPMLESRSFHCAVRFGKFIVVCGGTNGRERLRSCEIYDPGQNTWRFISSMNSARSDAAAAVLNQKIYVAGGIDIFALSSMEVYSFETNSWTVISFMHIQRRSFALIPYNNFLYAIGGCTEVYQYNCLKSMERYNPQTNTWSFASPLKHRRMSFSACVLEDKIFIFGGYDGFSTFRTVSVYHYSINCWQELLYQLPTHISGSCAVLVNNITNAIDYTYYGRCLANNHNVVVDDKNKRCSRFDASSSKKNCFFNQKMLINYFFSESKKFKDTHYHQITTSNVCCSK